MANLTNSAKLIEEMSKKAYKTELPTVNNATVTVAVNGNTGTNSFTTNQASNSTLKITVGKSDVGLGNVDNTSDANKPISTATQAALDLKADKSDLSSVYKYKGSVASYSNLPSTGLTAGDVYNVEDTGMNYAWTGSAWDQLGATVDLSNYLAKDNTTAFTPTGDYNPATKKYVDDNAGTEYNAGEGISIGDVSMNARKGPSPEGFHVPSTNEWQGVKTIMTSLSLTTGDNWRINLHIPFAGSRYYTNAYLSGQGSIGYYWSSSPSSASSNNSRYIYMNSSGVYESNYGYRAHGFSVRCFKDSYVTPDSNWTVVQGALGSAGIFWNQSKGLISITDGTTGYTMMDKNLGSTTVYNDGDTLTEANMGNMYQWGNNYGFPSTGTISKTSSTQVNASGYGPTNPYSSDTFITFSGDWSSVQNDDLWGNTTGGTITQENVISNTGVLSVNGETGDVIVDTSEVSGVTTTQPSSPSEGAIYYDTTNDVLKTYDGSQWNEVGGGETYTAGDGIVIGEGDITASRGPCSEGYHIPTKYEGQKLIDIYLGLGLSGYSNFSTYFKIPLVGARSPTTGNKDNASTLIVWTSSSYSYYQGYAIMANVYNASSNPTITKYNKCSGYFIRPFKDTAVIPDSGWTTIYDGSSIATGAGIFYNSTLGLISASSDGQDWITIADKNVGATTTWSSGAPTTANGGNFFQWGNNYAFPGNDTTSAGTTSSTKVNASTYGPGNYYSSSTFITGSDGWDSSGNVNLWGELNATPKNIISNIGVLSVNGNTGAITGLATTSQVLTKTNTTSYTPTADYHPATKKYVDDKVTVVSGDSGTTYTIKVSSSAPASGTASNIITIVTD